MQTTVPCPICRHTLTFVAKAMGLACPFCRAAIRLPEGKIPMGKKVRCARCQGVFTAEAPPPAIRVYASALESCPSCNMLLAIRKDLPRGKKVRCFNCRKKFRPVLKEGEAAPRHDTSDAPVSAYNLLDEPHTGAPQPAPAPSNPPTPQSSDTNGTAPHGTGKRKTRFSKGASRSSITHLAADPMADDVLSLEVPPAAPAAPVLPIDDDEVDFFHHEPSVGFEAPRAAPKQVPIAAPKPIRPADAMRIPARKKKRKPTRPTPRPMQPPSIPEQEEIPSTSAVLEALAQKWHAPAPAEEETTPTEAGDIQVEETPKENVGAHVSAPTERPEHANGSLPDEPAPRPLSMQSALEAAAATALLDEPETNETDATPSPAEESPKFAEPPVRPVYKPMAPPQPAMPRPTPPPARKPTSVESWQLNIDWKKALTWTLPPLLLFVGVYYLFFDGGFGKPRVYPVEGTVFFEGKPAVGARVTLYLDAKKRSKLFPTGKVGEDGTFKLTTYQPDDGAPAGRYKVTIDRGQIYGDEYAELTKKFTPEEIAKISEERAEDPLYNRFSNWRESGLTAEITAGPSNRLEFILKLE